MHYTIERLMAGDAAVVGQFQGAQLHWRDILRDVDAVALEDLADRLSNEQFWFEQSCGGRWVGQEVMVWTGFASLYSTQSGYEGGFEARAEKLARAFARSMCSVEVKVGAQRAAKSYHIDLER